MTPPAQRRHGLGRGLDALLASSVPGRDAGPSEFGSALIEVEPARVRPNPEQPRRHFDDEGLDGLAESIRLHGLLHPIVVEADGDGHRLVAGERRLRAAQRAGVSTIPAIVRPAAESGRTALELALTENLLREDLNPLDEAAAYARLADAFGLSHEAIALRLGRSRPAVSNAIRLLNLPAPVQEAVATGALSAGHARALLGLREESAILQLARQIAADGLSVRATEQRVQRALEAPAAAEAGDVEGRPRLSPDDERFRRGLEEAIGLPVDLQRRRRGGRLVIEWSADEDLDNLYRRLGGPDL
jgi:ParB family transcriptional regulator, chromosome partitioning protein